MARFIITGEYKDKATKSAIKDLKGLEKQTGTFAKMAKKYYAIASAAAGYYAQKILKESIKNALDDEKSQRVLALTLANVANATDAAVIATEQQIAAMQSAYGVTDDLLRPALARLARSSGSASQAVYDLKLALDISAATGKSLEAVTGALGKALDGNYASLQRLGLGIDANILKTKDQNKIFGQLRKTFANFAANEAATTEGKFRRIAVAADEAKEIIGVALIDSINSVVDTQGGVDGLTKSFNDLAYAISDTIRGLTTFVNNFNAFSKKFNVDLVSAIPILGGWLRGFQAVGKQQRINISLQQAYTRQVISARNAEWAALNAKKQVTDEITGGTKKTVEQLMAEEAARKAGFKITEDIDSIQTVAAAKRLEESRQYKMSIIDAAQTQYESLKSNYERLNAIWEAQTAAFNVYKTLLQMGIRIPVAMEFSSNIRGGTETAPTIITGADIPAPRGASGMTLAKEAAIAARKAREAVAAEQARQQFGSGVMDMSSTGGNQQIALGGQTINVQVNAGVIAEQERLVSAIASAVTQNYRSGNPILPAGYIGG